MGLLWIGSTYAVELLSSLLNMRSKRKTVRLRLSCLLIPVKRARTVLELPDVHAQTFCVRFNNIFKCILKVLNISGASNAEMGTKVIVTTMVQRKF